MKEEIKEICSTCKYHDIAGFDKLYAGETEGMGGTGLCRRRSPQITGPWDKNEFRFGFWPTTLETEWCGEWSDGRGRLFPDLQ